MSALQDLLVVQDLDLALDQLRHRREHLPAREELARLDARAGDLLARRRSGDASLSAVVKRLAEAEAELATTEKRAATVNTRMYSGEVTASRELQAMAADVEQLKARASHLEDVVLELMDERQPLDDELAAIESELAEVAGQRHLLTDRIAQDEAGLDAEMDDVTSRRTDAAKDVPDKLMATYQRLRTRLGGVGVARLTGNRCDGCHLALSSAELEAVRHLPEGELYTCEQCSRILVP